MIHVIAVITAKPGLRARILEAFLANVPAVRAEAGSWFGESNAYQGMTATVQVSRRKMGAQVA